MYTTPGWDFIGNNNSLVYQKELKGKKTLWVKDLLDKEHDCYKIYTLLTKSISAYPSPSIDKPPIWIPPSPHFYKNILIPLIYDFSKIATPLWIREFTLCGKFSLLWHAISFVSNISCWWCYVCLFVTTTPFKTEDIWINKTKAPAAIPTRG